MTTKAERAERRRQRRQGKQQIDKAITNDNADSLIDDIEARSAKRHKNVKPLEAKTEAQGHYILAIQQARLVFGKGPAGTGKTYICGAMAADALLSGQVDKIIITRPAVEAGESFGFLPGELEEKYSPYIQPLRDVFEERLGKARFAYMLKRGIIEAAPLAFMRGRTFKDAFVILDEAQNTTPTQMKLFLTRVGSNCKLVVNGDPKQKDISGESGLEDAIRRLRYLRAVQSVTFERSDVVRSGLAQQIVEAYES